MAPAPGAWRVRLPMCRCHCCPPLSLSILALLVAAAAAKPYGSTIEGVLRVQANHNAAGGRQYILEGKDRTVVALSLPHAQLQHGNLFTGIRLRVQGRIQVAADGSSTLPTLVVTNLTHLRTPASATVPHPSSSQQVPLLAAPALDPALVNQASPMNVLFVILKMRGQPPATTTEELSKILFADTARSLGSLFSSCSYGALHFDATTADVVGPVPLPSAGVTAAPDPQYTWSAGSCNWDMDLYGLSYAALKYIRDNKLATLQQHRRVAFILPAGSPCSFLALGEIGCSDRWCFSWYSQNAVRSASAFGHELSHSFALNHAAKGSNQYGDYSCLMGYSGSNRCPNAPHLYQLGWAGPLADLNALNLPATASRIYNLPAAHLSPRHMLRVSPTWPGSTATFDSYFVAYRLRDGFRYDADLSDDYSGKVSIYSFSGRPGTGSPLTLTHHLASLGPGERWAAPSGGLTVAVGRGLTNATARVVLCRFTPSWREDNCGNGVDDDCDGLVDDQDPDCPGYQPGAASPAGNTANNNRRAAKRRSPSPACKEQLLPKHRSPAPTKLSLKQPPSSPRPSPSSPRRSLTPKASPKPGPLASPSPGLIPSPSPSPSPGLSPSASPSPSPSPSLSPIPSPSPSPSPSPDPSTVVIADPSPLKQSVPSPGVSPNPSPDEGPTLNNGSTSSHSGTSSDGNGTNSASSSSHAEDVP